MRGYVATTDCDWFQFLRDRQPLEEVNFWQPSAHGFKAPPGTPFFFKLKAPHNAIGGFGIFARYEPATPRLAWEAFGEKNGASSFASMLRRVGQYATAPGSKHRVGCIMVAQPVFFARPDWVPQPKDWKKPVMSGAGYELDSGEGLRIWQECQQRALHLAPAAKVAGTSDAQGAAESEQPFYGSPRLIAPRLGQGTFRVAVTSIYGGACAVTGEHSLPVLEAAHIKPYALSSSHTLRNGLLLRADVHRLFDAGYVTITPEYRFEVSQRLSQEWENGKIYYALQGRTIVLPESKEDRPGVENLEWHNENVFEKPAA